MGWRVYPFLIFSISLFFPISFHSISFRFVSLVLLSFFPCRALVFERKWQGCIIEVKLPERVNGYFFFELALFLGSFFLVTVMETGC